MKVFRINDSLSKEENLELAKAYSDKAKELQIRFKEILDEVNREFPAPTFGLSKTKLEKLRQPNEAYDRVVNAIYTFNSTKSTFETRERSAKEKAEKEAQTKLVKEREQDKVNIINEAIAYCISNGRIFNQDGLTIDTAISIANDIAFQNEIKLKEFAIGDDFIDFSGQNCEEPCEGWNPNQRRCECGNRRVSWSEGYNSDFRNMEIYAEAY
jgi:hypothetical protein